jgi:hypothetical protein
MWPAGRYLLTPVLRSRDVQRWPDMGVTTTDITGIGFGEWNWLRNMSGVWQCVAEPPGSDTIAELQYLYYFKNSYSSNNNWRISNMSVSVFETRCQVSLIVSHVIMMT